MKTDGNQDYGMPVEDTCRGKFISLENIGSEAFNVLFHRSEDCPLKFVNNSNKKTRGAQSTIHDDSRRRR